ncbi:MAG: thiamine phosphate synthase [Candidatus Dadabacteria bacterium]|nr:MAG: thiamine phosphate synthase [Candidatus Dadabacteria bacterium]
MKKYIARLHVISSGTTFDQQIESIKIACRAKVELVQLRAKNIKGAELKKLACEALKLCEQYGTNLIINDDPVLAAEVGAYGVHLGINDPGPDYARGILGEQAVVGGTAHSVDEFVYMAQAGVDYIGLGPYRESRTKSLNVPPLGLEGLKRILSSVRSRYSDIPVIAIGGITPHDLPLLLSYGVYGVAVCGAVYSSGSPISTVAEFLKFFKETGDGYTANRQL